VFRIRCANIAFLRLRSLLFLRSRRRGFQVLQPPRRIMNVSYVVYKSFSIEISNFTHHVKGRIITRIVPRNVPRVNVTQNERFTEKLSLDRTVTDLEQASREFAQRPVARINPLVGSRCSPTLCTRILRSVLSFRRIYAPGFLPREELAGGLASSRRPASKGTNQSRRHFTMEDPGKKHTYLRIVPPLCPSRVCGCPAVFSRRHDFHNAGGG